MSEPSEPAGTGGGGAGGESYPATFGSYVLLESLGRGGMAEVDLACPAHESGRLSRFVAIKRMLTKFEDTPSAVRAFAMEARLHAELQHENIAQVFDFGQVGGRYYLAMEYVPGVHLRHVQRVLASRAQVPPFRVTFRILADVLSALQYAHDRRDTFGQPMQLVHGDVNPRNIMLSTRGDVKLIDFGISVAYSQAWLGADRPFRGKFAYLAPEQIVESGTVDGRTDLYALALVMHELLEGRSPFAGMTEERIVRETLAMPVPAVKIPPIYPDVELLRSIHDRAMAKSIEDRYPDAAAMREDILRAANAVGGLASREEMAEFLRRVAPDDVLRITRLLEAHRAPAPAPTAEVPPPPPPPAATTMVEPTPDARQDAVSTPQPDGEADRSWRPAMPRPRMRALERLTLSPRAVRALAGVALVGAVLTPWASAALGLFDRVPPPMARERAALRPELVWLPGDVLSATLPDPSGSGKPHEWNGVVIRPFGLCRAAVTQSQWEALMGENPSDCTFGCGEDLPVQGVLLHEAVSYLNALSATEGLRACYRMGNDSISGIPDCDGYRLPTYEEWWYGAAAGSPLRAYGLAAQVNGWRMRRLMKAQVDVDPRAQEPFTAAVSEEHPWGLSLGMDGPSEWIEPAPSGESWSGDAFRLTPLDPRTSETLRLNLRNLLFGLRCARNEPSAAEGALSGQSTPPSG